jgi:HAMP domain-containing protein
MDGENPQSMVKDLSENVEASDAATQMSDNQRSLRDNHLNEAIERNQSLLQEFQEWDDQLNDRPVTDAELKMQLLDEQSRNLDQLTRNQQQIGDELLKNNGDPQTQNELQSRQDELNREAGRIRRMLDRLQLPKSADALEAAEHPMQKLSQQIEKNQPTEALSQQAEQKLADAQDAIDQERQSLESSHQLELLTELLPKLLQIALRQKLMNQVALHLNQEVETAGRWNRSLLKNLNEIRDGQQNLLNDLDELRTALGEIEAVELALSHVLETMTQSYQTLDSREIKTAATNSMPRSLRQLEILLDVLKRMAHDQQADNENNPSDQPAGEETEQGEQQTIYVELLLLRAVQQQIQEESRELSAREFSEGSNEQTQEAWKRLEEKQADVLRLLQDIMTRQQESQTPVDEVI